MVQAKNHEGDKHFSAKTQAAPRTVGDIGIQTAQGGEFHAEALGQGMDALTIADGGGIRAVRGIVMLFLQIDFFPILDTVARRIIIFS